MFSRSQLGEPGPPLSDDAIAELAQLTEQTPDSFVGVIPAGFTYLGQFVDHDITFDPTPLSAKTDDPLGRADFRTPRFDLDSVYGAGPADQPYLYEWADRELRGVKLVIGLSTDGKDNADDLPRNAQELALVGDPRNDENLIVAQLHLLFLLFHNKVVEHVAAQGLAGHALFLEAQRIVRWHYQWIVVHDFLERIVGHTIDGVERKFLHFEDEPFIPFEFSGAAYRFGHSMVRDSYDLNDLLGGSGKPKPVILAHAESPGKLAHLGGFRQMPPRLGIMWERFYELSADAPLMSNRIDTSLVPHLRDLPKDVDGQRRGLATLNLLRARDLGLPTGQQVAHAMGIDPLPADEIYRATVATAELRSATPLWYYVLAEARTLHEGKQLGPIGGQIVAEVLVGLLEADAGSYVHRRPAWVPNELLAENTNFTMADLVRFTAPRRPHIESHL
jgi:hypothetical protein